jgi:hypothetical protein
MVGAFDFVEQRTNVVVRVPRYRTAHIYRLDTKRTSGLHGFALSHGDAQILIDDDFEWPTGASGLCLQPSRYVIIKR